MNKDEYYMNIALEEANKAFNLNEVPVGAVIVLNDEIISCTHNLREHNKNIISHAEILAVLEANKKINDWRLEDATMYVTLFPCPMCASAITQSRIKRLVVGAPSTDLKNTDIVYKILDGNNTSPKVQLIENINSDGCKDLLSKFFKKKRNN